MIASGNRPRPRFLVLRGSPDRAVARVATVIADELRASGMDADVATPGEIDGLAGYDGLVLGSRTRWHRWHPAAVRFLRRHAAVLRVRPMWLFQVERHAGTMSRDAAGGPASERLTRRPAPWSDGPAPVAFGPRGTGLAPAREWTRRIAASVTPVPAPTTHARSAPPGREAVAAAARLA